MVLKTFRDNKRRIRTYVMQHTDPQGQVRYAYCIGKPSDYSVASFFTEDLATAMQRAEEYANIKFTI